MIFSQLLLYGRDLFCAFQNASRQYLPSRQAPSPGRNSAEAVGIGPTVKQRTLTPASGPIKIKNFKSTGLSIQRTLLHNLPRRGAFFYSYLRRQAPPSPLNLMNPLNPLNLFTNLWRTDPWYTLSPSPAADLRSPGWQE